jgi:hypothetical protein
VREEEAVAEVDGDQSERGRDEREPEALHLPQQGAVELETELLAAVPQQREVDGERAGEVAGDDADRAEVVDDHEQHRRGDGDRDVGEARGEEGERALLDAEERG